MSMHEQTVTPERWSARKQWALVSVVTFGLLLTAGMALWTTYQPSTTSTVEPPFRVLTVERPQAQAPEGQTVAQAVLVLPNGSLNGHEAKAAIEAVVGHGQFIEVLEGRVVRITVAGESQEKANSNLGRLVNQAARVLQRLR